MGGKREHHRCMALLQQGDGDDDRDDDVTAQRPGLTSRDHTTTTTTTSTTTTSHVTTTTFFCPVTIHIEECSDPENEKEHEHGEESDARAIKNDNEWCTPARVDSDPGVCGLAAAVAGERTSHVIVAADRQQQQCRTLMPKFQPGGHNNSVVGGTASSSLSSSSSSSSLLLSVPGQPPRLSSSLSACQLSSLSSTSSSSSSSSSLSNNNNFLEVPPMVDSSELSTLKATAVRLNLRTRSSSFLEWQAKWLYDSPAPPQFPARTDEGSGGGVGEGEGEGGGGGDGLTNRERRDRINEALDWLKSELKEMRSMDQHLARQLLSLRHDIHQLRLRRSCQEHRDLLDDVQSELEEQEEMSDVLDLPHELTLNDTPLKQIGVTRMNISARRFSMC